ncbi:MAG TPA: helix-turn-helix domain-containing protein [Caulobacteraceae bacterium]|jgi:AcrR family transcriptional regulator|nr:helix-turn-helix domain-containing protein [Caulobacteraceae bacterium]
MPSDVPTPSPRRRPKGDKRARTRAAIVQAAAQLVEEVGYERVTLQAIARRAGLSNGAIYGNFRNRDELFATLGPTYWPRIRATMTPGSSFAEKMRAMAEATIAALPERRRVATGRLTGLAHTLANAGLQARAQEIAATGYAGAAAWWRSVADDGPLPMEPEVLVRVLNALAEGLTLQRLLTPELIPDEVIYAAFAALAPAAQDTGRSRN